MDGPELSKVVFTCMSKIMLECFFSFLPVIFLLSFCTLILEHS